MTTAARRLESAGVSIVCVFNDMEVRTECLDRSIDRYRGFVDVDFIPLDNRAHQFSTAGAALNHGAAMARHDLVVLVHQDVYLHSIDRLVEAGASLLDRSWSMLGASGVTSSGEVIGLLRDRTDLIGRSAPTPVEVDTLDEVLFMVRRDTMLSRPLIEEDDLAWHAYAVEYATRLRTSGERVGAVDLEITHNSLTINLDRLDVAHRVVGDMYPDLKPIHTTCGTIQGRRLKMKDLPVVRDHRWRVRWIRNSVGARRLSRKVPVTVILSDIRHDVDLLKFGASDPLHVINVNDTEAFVEGPEAWLRLSRLGKPVDFIAVDAGSGLDSCLERLSERANVLVTGLDEKGIIRLCGGIGADRRWAIGIQSGDHWALAGRVLDDLPQAWSKSAAVPLGSRPPNRVPFIRHQEE